MGLKSLNIQNEKEKDDEYEKRISNLFYSNIFNRIKDNIKKSYKYIFKVESELELAKLTMKYLIILRNYIYEERIFLIDDMESLLYYFPVKYLNIFLSSIEELNNSQIIFGFYKFFFIYSNKFIKYAINKIINDYSKNIKYKYFDMMNFEKIVNEKISNIALHNQKPLKRNIFFLLGITKLTKNYVDKLRKKENLEFYKFFGLKRLEKIFIDGVDKSEINKPIIDVTNNNKLKKINLLIYLQMI